MQSGLLGNMMLVLVLVLSGCAALPPLDGRVASTVLADTAGTRIGRAVAPLAAAHPALTGVHVLTDGRDAFAARMLMAGAAERSLDVQSYIWRNDMTGTLLMSALRAAAGRGVRVRLLLDDNNTVGLDPALALLDADPNIEVRLFNPFAWRSARMLGFLTDFRRLNRRMHNKSFTVDSQATIVGGRNVGDEYFDARGAVLFADLDILAVGSVVGAVARDFDRYWNSPSAYPAQNLIGRPGPSAEPAFTAQVGRTVAAPQAQAYMASVRASTFATQLSSKTLELEWAPVRLISDDPAKVLAGAAPGSNLAQQLPGMLGEPGRQVDLVSPYFVPGPSWTQRLAQIARAGVQVRVLTNSLEATDVAAVHAGYGKWRRNLLEGGVKLYELKRTWPRELEPKRSGSGSAVGSSSGSSLHAKTVVVDQQRVFVGSFNFDPRSAELNTEMGFVIESPTLATLVGTVLDARLPARAYEVRLSPDGRLYWLDSQPGGLTVRHDTEPGTVYWRRALVDFMSLLPIDWML